jgi:hypothetical protein
MPYHNISAKISDRDHAVLIDSINDIKNQLPFLVNLTSSERNAGLKGQNKLAFLMAAHDYASNNGSLIPASLDLAEWTNDIALLQKMGTLLQAINVLQEGIRDTELALRIEAQSAALQFYKYAKIAASSQVPGVDVIVDDLRRKLG